MSKNYLLLIILALTFAIIPLASATDDIGNYKQFVCVNLWNQCSNCTFMNISKVLYPDTTQAQGQVTMDKAGTFYNYTFCRTTNLGEYKVAGIGDLNGELHDFNYVFHVTPAGGAENNTTLFIILTIASIVLFVLAFVFKNYIFSILSGFLFLVTGMYGMFYGFGDITNLYTRIISYVIIGFGAIVTIVSAIDLIRESEGGGGYNIDDDN